jgi:hypothetical protein
MSTPSWMNRIKKTSPKEIEKIMSKSVSEDNLLTGKYVPILDVTKLTASAFPGNYLRLRILPAMEESNHQWVYFTHSFFLRDYDIGFDDAIFIRTEEVDKNPISKFRFELYRDGSLAAKNFAKGTWHKTRGYCNVIARTIPLVDEQGKTNIYENCGPRVLRMPEAIYKPISESFTDPILGDPTDIEKGFDFRLTVNIIEANDEKTGNKKKYPEYSVKFIERPLRAHEDNEVIGKWLNNLHDLSKEYVESPEGVFEEIAEKLRQKWGGTFKAQVQGASTIKPDKNEDLEPARSKTKVYDDEDPKPRRARHEEDEPRRARQDEDEPRRARHEEDEPRRARQDEDEPRRARQDEDEPRRARQDEDEPRRTRQDEDEPRRTRQDEDEPRRTRQDERRPRLSDDEVPPTSRVKESRPDSVKFSEEEDEDDIIERKVQERRRARES